MRRWWVWERAIEVLLLLLNLWVGGLVVLEGAPESRGGSRGADAGGWLNVWVAV
jgi:hypothetical protein